MNKQRSRSTEWRAKNPPCVVDDCNNLQIILKRGLCNMHLLRLQRHGSLEKPKRISHKKGIGPWIDENGNRRQCVIEACIKPIDAAGLCSGHYHRKIRYGDPLFSPIIRRICAMGKCQNLTTASHQMCVNHAKSIYNARQKGTIPRIAREAVGNALKYGKLIRQPCEVCGHLKVHAHHSDYEKPLDIQWLCPKHHMEVHAKLRQWCRQKSA